MKYIFDNFFWNLILDPLFAIPVSLVFNALAWFFVVVIFRQSYAFLVAWKLIYIFFLAVEYFFDFIISPVVRLYWGIKASQRFQISIWTGLEVKVGLRKQFRFWDWDWTPEEFQEELHKARIGKLANDVTRKIFTKLR